MWNVRKRGNQYQYQLLPMIVKYKSAKKYSIVQVAHATSGEVLPNMPGMKAKNTFIMPIPPVYNQSIDTSKVKRLPVKSNFYCNFIRYQMDESSVVTGPFINQGGNEFFMTHRQIEGKDVFELKMKSLDLMLESISTQNIRT